MKDILPLFLLAILFFSCENTEVQEQNNKMIGFVNVELLRIHESGVVLGKFSANYYLSGIKVDLIKNGAIIKTTHTFADTNSDNIYLFENIELNVPYRIRITLNDDFIDTTDEFSITEKDTLFIPDNTEGVPEWLKNGKYYIGMLNGSDNNIVFNLYTNSQYLNVIPNPIVDSGSIEFLIETSGKLDIEIFDIRKINSKIFYSGYNQAGIYRYEFGDDLDNGLYFVRMIIGDKTYYCPFIKGLKGCPKTP